MNNADHDVTAPETGASATPSAGSENCLPVGTRLAEFEVTSVIGEGGFGIVYLAFDHSLQRTVAVKEYMPAALAARGPDHGIAVRAKRHEEAFAAGLRSFINEARLLAQFDHSALVKVYRFWEQNNTAYMAMRYYEGETFKTVVKNNPAMVDEAWLKRILKPILEALDTLYKAHILHRDISPENIMIQPNGEAVLLDFGAARQIVTGLTKSLTVILKPGYAPVEQYADDDSMTQGPWTDIYSLSAVMYSAIAKKPPPTAVARMLNDPIEPLEGGDHPGFDKQFLAAIDRGLAVRPEGRPQSIAEFARLLGIDMSVPSHAEAPVRLFPPAPAAERSPAIAVKARAPQSAAAAVPAASGASATSAMPAAPNKAGKRAWLIAASGVAVVLAAGLWLAGRHRVAPAPSETAASSAPVVAQAPASAPKEEIIPWETLSKQRPAEAASSPVVSSSAVSSSAASVAKPVDAAPKASERVKPKPAPETSPRHAADTHTKVAEDEAAKPAGSVTLAIKPWANVFVDGDPKGVSPPLKKLSLPEGRHQIKVVNPNFPEYVVNVTVSAGKPAAITRDFSVPAQ